LGAKSWPAFPPVTVVVLGSQGNSERRRHPHERSLPLPRLDQSLESKVLERSTDGRAAGVVLRGELTLGWELIAWFVRFITDGTPERICNEFPRLAHQCLLGLGKPSQSLALDAVPVLAFLSLLLPASTENSQFRGTCFTKCSRVWSLGKPSCS
jgi:hypothetical protein